MEQYGQITVLAVFKNPSDTSLLNLLLLIAYSSLFQQQQYLIQLDLVERYLLPERLDFFLVELYLCAERYGLLLQSSVGFDSHITKSLTHGYLLLVR
jgi:hypothetical protein